MEYRHDPSGHLVAELPTRADAQPLATRGWGALVTLIIISGVVVVEMRWDPIGAASWWSGWMERLPILLEEFFRSLSGVPFPRNP